MQILRETISDLLRVKAAPRVRLPSSACLFCCQVRMFPLRQSRVCEAWFHPQSIPHLCFTIWLQLVSIKLVRFSLAKIKTRASSRSLSTADFKTTASSQKAVRQKSLAQLPKHRLGDSTLSLLSLSSLSAKWEYPPTALHHLPAPHGITTERRDSIFQAQHYRKSETRKKNSSERRGLASPHKARIHN